MKDGSFSKVVPTFESTTVWLPAVRLSGLHVLWASRLPKLCHKTRPSPSQEEPLSWVIKLIVSSVYITTYHNLSSLGRKNKDPRSRLFYSTCEWFRNGLLFKTTELMSTLRLSVFLICIHLHLGMSMGQAHWKLNTLCNGLQYSYI